MTKDLLKILIILTFAVSFMCAFIAGMLFAVTDDVQAVKSMEVMLVSRRSICER